MDARVHKNEHRHKNGDHQRIGTPQEEVDYRTKTLEIILVYYFTLNFNCIVFNSIIF
jgi:hypothetical protein